MKTLTEVRALIQAEVERHGTLTATAREWGVSIPYVCDLVYGRRDLGPTVLDALGLERVVLYREVEIERQKGAKP